MLSYQLTAAYSEPGLLSRSKKWHKHQLLPKNSYPYISVEWQKEWSQGCWGLSLVCPAPWSDPSSTFIKTPSTPSIHTQPAPQQTRATQLCLLYFCCSASQHNIFIDLLKILLIFSDLFCPTIDTQRIQNFKKYNNIWPCLSFCFLYLMWSMDAHWSMLNKCLD